MRSQRVVNELEINISSGHWAVPHYHYYDTDVYDCIICTTTLSAQC
jgi:hypothetical protein